MEFLQEVQASQISSQQNIPQQVLTLLGALRSQPEVYQRFLKAFTDAYTQSGKPTTPEELARRVQESLGDLLTKNKDLLEKFESFLPQNQKKSSTPETETKDPAAEPDAEEVD